MATTTPNYGWSVPTSTDLVKDGATAIETLGDAIDASMNTALGTKKAGMVLLNTTSFSGVAAASVPASTFSATYTNYKALVNLTNSNAGVSTSLRLRSSGTDNTTSNYQDGKMYSLSGGSVTSSITGATTLFELMPNSGTSNKNFEIIFFSPFATAVTSVIAYGGSNRFPTAGSYEFSATTSFDAFTIFPAANTTSGTIQVFGYNV